MKQRVGIIGVGAIGKPLATHLLQEGYHITICPHRNHAPIEEPKQQGARRVTSPAEVCFGEQRLGASKKRDHALTVVVMSTIAPAAMQSLQP
jgi:predicted dinucleotide-binding enzyme